MKNPTSKFLARGDFSSPAWAHIKLQVQEDLAAARANLEAVGTNHEQTLIQRGRIAALKDLLAHESAPAPDPGRQGRQDRATASDGGDDFEGT